MDHPQTPRILAPHLQSFQHKLVRIVGKVVQLRGEAAVIDAGGNIDLILNRVRGLYSRPSVEIRTCFVLSWAYTLELALELGKNLVASPSSTASILNEDIN